MSDFDSNPFADPEAGNPFADPSVRQQTQPVQQRTAGLDDYNPFADQDRTKMAPQMAPQMQAPPPQPAVMMPTEQPPAYSPSPAQQQPTAQQQQLTEDLQRRQEELERKAAELARKEQEMKSMGYNSDARRNNFPPLPEKCCVQPCFYQDFSVDIPLEFQRIVKTVYYLWLFYVGLLFLNVIGSLAYFIASIQNGASNKSGITFGLSILFLVLFTPCSFVCWYRPLYKAFRSDSSFNFFVFFFIFFFQFCVTILQCLGIDGWGTCGWIGALGMMSNKSGVAAAVIMIVIAIMFTLYSAAVMVMLLKVHRIYRSTGASFEKAQAEFAQGVMSNRTVQQTAGNVAASAARTAVDQQVSGNRY